MLCEFWKPLGLALLWKTASHYAWIAHTRLILLTSSVRVAHGQLCVLGPPFITHSISSTFYCCCDKLSQTHSVKEYKFIILHFCKLEVWNVSNSNKIKVSAGHIPFWRFWGRIYVSLYVPSSKDCCILWLMFPLIHLQNQQVKSLSCCIILTSSSVFLLPF